MYRGTPHARYINVKVNNGGLGDSICRLVPVRYALKLFKNVTIFLWVPDFMFEIANVLMKKEIQTKQLVINKASNIPMAPESIRSLKTKEFPHTQYTYMKSDIIKHGARMLVDRDIPDDECDYPVFDIKSPYKFDQNIGDYIVLTPCFTAPSREMPASAHFDVCYWAQQRGLKVVILGSAQTQVKDGLFIRSHFNPVIDKPDFPGERINLLGKTALIEAAQIMKHAKAVVGLDNGLLHLAACTDVPIVAAFSTVDPETRTPQRHGKRGWRFYPVGPDEDLECRYCQTNMGLHFGHDFRWCYYGDYKCLGQISRERLVKALDEAVSE